MAGFAHHSEGSHTQRLFIVVDLELFDGFEQIIGQVFKHFRKKNLEKNRQK